MLNEQKAIDQIKQGQIKGLDALVNLYQVQAMHVAYLITQDRGLAEDASQDAFCLVYQHIDQFDQERPFKPWLLRIVANQALQIAKRLNRLAPIEDEVGQLPTLHSLFVATDWNPEDEVEMIEMKSAVREALKTLSPAQRSAIVLRYFLNLTEPEIAANLEIPIGTVKWRLHAAKKHLRTLLRPLTGGQ